MRNEEDAEENSKCGNINSHRQLSMRKPEVKKNQWRKTVPVVVDE